MTTTVRPIVKILRGQAASDGAGVRLTRSIGGPALTQLDPFLLLDEFRSDDAADYIGGFPDHPHRGFETVTYMLAGRMRHGDNKGNVGLLRPGSVQWMTAGRGLVHSEMPEQENGLMWGFQLWVNLPASDKMTAPRYQDIDPELIPVVTHDDGLTVKVIAGRYEDAKGPVDAHHTETIYLDLSIPEGGRFDYALPEGHNAFTYPFEGQIMSGGERVNRGEVAIYGAGDRVEITALDGPARTLLVAGRPLKEQVARYGPFVMNTEAEIRQAFADYQAGQF
ncbi:pirin family protein [Govanella unica]|uniref:Pirin family protein n=1 Tax=Govanella unica TaxID=2975056 RepID=A0A9X3TZQ1_9PROT|nr:pirin family protein [Govania unica]MDA5194729.1 pirin family protein [Govania unica]